MAIVSFREVPEKRDRLQGIDRRERERVWIVFVDDAATPEDDILAHASAPGIFDPHPDAPALVCRSIDTSHAGRGNFVWIVRALYSAEPVDLPQVEKLTVPDPLDRSAKIRIQFAPWDRNVWKDLDDQATLNSAGDPYLDPITIADFRIRIAVTKNVTAWPTFLFSYRNKVNDDEITIRGITFPAGTLKFCPGDVPEFHVENGVTFLPIEYFLEQREEGWDEIRLDCGFNYLDGDGVRRPIEIDGVPPPSPVLLDGAGHILANPAPSNAVYRTHEVHLEADFSALPLT
jgi:hypothetical protein